MKRGLIAALCVAILSVSLSGCYTLKHEVGSGSAGGTQVSEAQWYALWGLIPLNNVDSKTMAGGASNYTVQSQHTVIDVVISMVTQWFSVVRQTVTVTK